MVSFCSAVTLVLNHANVDHQNLRHTQFRFIPRERFSLRLMHHV